MFTRWHYSSTCHGRSLGWTATCFGRPLLRCTNNFAMLKYLHPTATCLTRPAECWILSLLKRPIATAHYKSAAITTTYFEVKYSTCVCSRVRITLWINAVNFSHIFSIVRFISHCIQHCNWPLCFLMLCMCCELYVCVWFDIMAHMSVSPAMITRWHYCISVEMVTGWVHWIVNVSKCKEVGIARRKHLQTAET